MPFFPNPKQAHYDLMDHMRAKAMRKPHEGIEQVFPWECEERSKPVQELVLVLAQEFDRNLCPVSFEELDKKIQELEPGPLRERLSFTKERLSTKFSQLPAEVIEKHIELYQNFREYLSKWQEIQNSIQEGTCDFSGPTMFRTIDAYRDLVPCFLQDYESLGFEFSQELTKAKSKLDPAPKPSLKQVSSGMDLKKLAWGGLGLVAALGFSSWLRRKQPETPASEASEPREIKIGPPRPASYEEQMILDHDNSGRPGALGVMKQASQRALLPRAT